MINVRKFLKQPIVLIFKPWGGRGVISYFIFIAASGTAAKFPSVLFVEQMRDCTHTTKKKSLLTNPHSAFISTYGDEIQQYRPN